MYVGNENYEKSEKLNTNECSKSVYLFKLHCKLISHFIWKLDILVILLIFTQ